MAMVTSQGGPEAGAAVRELTQSFRSMASDVELRLVDPGPDAPEALARATARIRAVARHLTRFDDGSALSRANRYPDSWHTVPVELAEAVIEAERAHRETDGLFDPRVIDALVAWGYDRTFAMVVGHGAVDPAALPELPDPADTLVVGPTPVPTPAERWAPSVLPGEGRRMLHLGGARIDLGGIGKGLAVRQAATALAGAAESVLVDAGGDQWLGGRGPDGDGWKVGVEDPHGGTDPLLVLSVTDLGVATSSTRRRRWHAQADGAVVHHLVDPRTGLPGGDGIASVTVLHPDPAWAEVWSKVLFLRGLAEVAAHAEVRGLAAAWVTHDGAIATSSAMDPHVVWRAGR